VSYSQIHSLLTQFRTRYPMGSLVSELLMIHDGNYIVRASVQMGGTTLATGLASVADVEAAEDRAKVRALEALGIQSSSLLLGTASPVSSESEPMMQLNSEPPLGTVTPAVTSSVAPTVTPDVPTPVSPANVIPLIDPRSMPPALTELPPVPAVATPKKSIPKTTPVVADLYAHTILDEDPDAALTADPTVLMDDVLPSLSTGDRLFHQEFESSDRPKPTTSAPAPVTNDITIDLSEEIAQIDVEIKRLGWTKKRGSDHLKKMYGKATRRELTPEELFDFLDYLKDQPANPDR
jgi:hypothetical protein